MSNKLDLSALREQFLNEVFDEKTFQVDAQQLADYSASCGELAARYTDPAHPDFQAPPTFASSLQSDRRLPDNFPKLPGLGMDAGKAVEPIEPIRAGAVITGRTHLHDIYAKTGRSGRMVFFVTRMEIFDESSQLLARADTRVVVREKPSEQEQEQEQA